MDFSELFKSSGIIKFSPDGKYVANAAAFGRLVLRDVGTLQITQLYSCMDEISRVDWSSDSKFVLCAMYKRAAVEVWSVDDSKWKCTIDQGPAGLSYALFSPDGRHVLCVADFQLRITVWSLVHGTSVAHIKHPKFSGKGIDFTQHDGGRYMALAERRDCRDYVSIIVTDTWELVKHFPVQTKNLTDLKWSPDGKYIAIWDQNLDYNVLVYSPTGDVVAQYSAYEDALGVRNVKWGPSSQLIAVGSFDQKVRLLNHLTWKAIAEYEHQSEIKQASTTVFKETEYSGNSLKGDASVQYRSRYIIIEKPVSLKTIKINLNKPNPQIGISMLEWSADGRFLLTKDDNMPTVLFIWETSKLSLCAVLIQMDTIKCAKWDPKHSRLALCTGNGRLYMWSTEGASCVEVPAVNFHVQRLKWNPDGESIVLADEACFCCAYAAVNQ